MQTVARASSATSRPQPARLVIATTAVLAVDVAVIGLRQLDLARAGLLTGMIIFALLIIWCRRSTWGLPIKTIMVIAALCQLPGLFSRPLLSDDAYRYVWDGRVQLAGISPYRYPPLDPVLAWLRDPVLFPPGAEGPLINRSWVRTIYPPIAELWFSGVAAVTPWRLGTLGVQIGAAVLVVITTGLLARLLIIRELPAGAALLYGACPATTIEAANGAHVDVLAALFLVAMGYALTRGRTTAAGLFLGLAAGVKLVPLLLLPVFLRRPRIAVSAVAAFIAGYLPHLLTAGTLVVGFLPGYLREEGFDGSRRFALLIFLPEQARLPVALTLATGLAVLAVVRSRLEPALTTCCWLYGAAFLIATPAYPWYLLPFIVIAIMAGRWEWLLLWPAAYLGFLHDREPVLQAIGYGSALLMIIIVSSRRLAATRARLAQAARPSAGSRRDLDEDRPPADQPRRDRRSPTLDRMDRVVAEITQIRRDLLDKITQVTEGDAGGVAGVFAFGGEDRRDHRDRHADVAGANPADHLGHLAGPGPSAEGSSAVDIDAKAERDEIGIQFLHGPDSRRIQVALAAEGILASATGRITSVSCHPPCPTANRLRRTARCRRRRWRRCTRRR